MIARYTGGTTVHEGEDAPLHSLCRTSRNSEIRQHTATGLLQEGMR